MAFISTLRAYLKLSFHLFTAFFQLLKGIWKISKLPRAPVTIFGGSRLKIDSTYMKHAHNLAHMLVDIGIPVLTGGGPGIMEAVNCGALSSETENIINIGISVKGLEDSNYCALQQLTMNQLFTRKWLLIQYSIGFAVFPGGFGTLDELMELLTLIQTKMRAKAPIILIGADYWQPLMDWIKMSALKNNLINEEEAALFIITDDINQAFNLLKEHWQKQVKLI